VSSTEYLIKDVQDYILEAMTKVKKDRISIDEFTDLMNPAIDLLENEEIFINDVEMTDGIVRFFY